MKNIRNNILNICNVEFLLILQGGWTLGFLTLPLISYAFPNTFHYQLFQPLFSLLLLALYFVVPESPRWLYSVGRKEEAKQILDKILVFNRKKETNYNSGYNFSTDSKTVSSIEVTRGRFLNIQQYILQQDIDKTVNQMIDTPNIYF